MNIRHILIYFFLFFTFPAALYPQHTGQVRGRVWSFAKDPEPAEVLPYASIVILNKSDSSFVKGVTTDTKGYFNLRFPLSEGKEYMLRASYMGYTPLFYELRFRGNSTLNLGDISLKDDGIGLDEITVRGVAPELRQVGDTTVINASAYRAPEGSNLLELVKRVPGLDYDPQTQTLTYNGLTINEIHVNGESFFADNFTIALENLPAELISEIKVYDKKSELEKITGVRSGRENYVLDLQTKGEFNGTLMTSAKAGFGNEGKKDYELLANYFKKGGDNFSLIGRSTNVDMRNDYKDNIHRVVGMNGGKRLGKGLMLNGNVAYNGGRIGNRSTGYTEEYLSSGNKYKYSAQENVNRNNVLNASVDMRLEVDKNTFLNVSGRMNTYEWKTSSNNRQATFAEPPGLSPEDPFAGIENVPAQSRVNDIMMDMLSSSKQYNYGVDANITRKLNDKGTSASVTLRGWGVDRKDKDFTLSSTTYYQLRNALGNDSVLYRNQYLYTPATDRDGGMGLLFTHPFTKAFRLQLSYGLNYSKEDSDRNTYDLSAFRNHPELSSELPPGYEAGFVDSLSNHSRSRTMNHEAVIRANYSDSIWDVIAELAVTPERRSLNQKTGLLQADTTIRNVGFRPNIMLSWKDGDNQVRLSYHGNTRQPSLTELLSLTDNRDPLNIHRGNPHLRPAYYHTVRLELQNHKKGMFAAVGWRQESNSHTRAITYNLETGGREIYPVNVNGNWDLDGNMRYHRRIRDFRIMADAMGSLGENVTLVNEGQSPEPDRSKTRSYGLNSTLRLSYLPQWGGVDCSGQWNYHHSTNTLRNTVAYTRDYDFGLAAYANLPGNFYVKTDAKYVFRNGTNIPKDDDNQVVWNAGLTWRFLKKKQAEIVASWVDILNQEKNYFRHASANGFSESHVRQTGGYFIVSLRYRFNYEMK